jgi:hypothetical protein
MRRACGVAGSPGRTAGAARPSATTPVIPGCPEGLLRRRPADAAARSSVRSPSGPTCRGTRCGAIGSRPQLRAYHDLIRRGAVPRVRIKDLSSLRPRGHFRVRSKNTAREPACDGYRGARECSAGPIPRCQATDDPQSMRPSTSDAGRPARIRLSPAALCVLAAVLCAAGALLLGHSAGLGWTLLVLGSAFLSAAVGERR